MIGALRQGFAHLSLHTQLGVLTAAYALLSLALLSLVVVGQVFWSAQQGLRQQQALMRPLLAAALTGPMIERNYAVVREIAVSIVASDIVGEIRVLSPDGIVVTHERAASVAPRFSAPMALDLEEGGLGFGRIELVLTDNPLAGTTDRLLWFSLAAALAAMLFAMLFYGRWIRWLGRRIGNLAAAVHAFAGGSYDQQVAESGTDEVGRLARDFNRMAEKVASTIDALEVSESRISAILASIGDGLIATDTTMRITYLNPIAEALTGWSQAEAVGRPVAEIFTIENALTGQPAEIPVARVLESGYTVGLANHTVLIARDGTRRHVADSAAPIRNTSGQLVGVVMVFRDVTESYKLHASLEASRTRLALALQGADLGLWDRNLATGETVFDVRYAAMLGYRLEELDQSYATWEKLVHPDDLPLAKRALQAHLTGEAEQYEAEVRMRHKSGAWVWILSRGRVTARDAAGWPLRITGTHLDVSDKKLAQAEIEQLAFYDALTGLPNRRLMLDRLQLALATARRERRYGALLFIDLDNFKHLNDSHGHAAGDQLLKEVVQRMAAQLRETDTLARLGGDEFVVLLTGLGRHAEHASSIAREVAEKLRKALSPGFVIDGSEFHTSASIGIALFPVQAEFATDLLRHADMAMYAAKEAGRNQVCFFEPAMQAAVEERLSLERELRQALERNELRLYLQAQVDTSGRTVGAEALLRWEHPLRGLVPPASFIALAEETGLIEPIGAWVMEATLAVQKSIEEQGHPLRVAVNVSPRQFHDPNFVARLRTLLQQSGVYASRLILEITEGLLLADTDATVARMFELEHLGVGLSIDDFGTGYSSLAYLKRLPLRELKIDRGFVDGLPRDVGDGALVRTILDIADSFGLEVVAEGVETSAQLAHLKNAGCKIFQGYLFGRALPAEEFMARLAQERAQSS